MSISLTPELIQACELAEAEAHENGFQSAPKEFSKAFGLGIKRFGDVSVTTMPKVDAPVYNCIMGLGVVEPATESLLDESISVFMQGGCDNYMARVSGFAQPAEISDWLLARGFKAGRNWHKLIRGNEPITAHPTSLRLVPIGMDHADDYTRIVASVFDMSPAYRPFLKGTVGTKGWTHYVLYDDKEPVSAGAMYISGNVAWLGFMGTLMTHRGRGAQGAMLTGFINEGLKQGCKWFIAETREGTPEKPNPSFSNAMRLGFEIAYVQKNYFHGSSDNPVKSAGRKLHVAYYSLKYELQRMLQKTGSQAINHGD